MILERYKPNFEGLAEDQARYLAERMRLPEVPEQLTGRDIYQIADSAGMDQADVVMTLATDATVTGVQVVEALVGRPIVRKAAAPPRTSRGPRRTVSVKRTDPRRIVWVGPNPKKQGSASYDRFALYREGMTVQEFLEAGGTTGDVKWDTERGFIKLEGQEE